MRKFYGPLNGYLEKTSLLDCRGHERDNQRKKVYQSEWTVEERVGRGRFLPTVEDIQNYIDQMLEDPWFKERFPNTKPIEVCEERNVRSGAYNQHLNRKSIIKISDGMRYELVVIHEVTHALLHYARHAYHGRLFARVYLDLVRHFMGNLWADTLQEEYDRNNVKYLPNPQPLKQYHHCKKNTDGEIKITSLLFNALIKTTFSNHSQCKLMKEVETHARKNKKYYVLKLNYPQREVVKKALWTALSNKTIHHQTRKAAFRLYSILCNNH